MEARADQLDVATAGRAAGPVDGRTGDAGGRGRVLRAAALALGVGLAVLVAHDGSPAWQVGRVAAVGCLTALVLAVQGRAGRRARGATALAAGVVGVAVGIGFLPYLTKEGPGLVGVAALVVTLAGVVLTAGGARSLTRGHGALVGTLTGVGVVVLSGVVVLVVSPAVAATNVPRPELRATAASAGLPARPVELRTTDGVRLAAWYVPSRNGAAVVLLHGAGDTRSAVLPHAAVLARHGFGVLAVDARGHGRSGGRAMDFGWHGDRDVAAATAFLARRDEVDPARIGLVGLSMGGEEAVGAAGADPSVRAVVAEGATARAAGDEAWLSDEFGWRGWLQERLESAQDAVTAALTDAPVPTSLHDAVRRSDARFLLVTAATRPDEGRTARWLRSAAPGRVSVWEVPGAGHTGGLRTEPRAWEERVTAFLDRAL